MKEWYVENGKNAIGPLTLKELETIKLTRSKLIWKEGMEEWQAAENIDEIKHLFAKLPPKLPNIIDGDNNSDSNKSIKYDLFCLKFKVYNSIYCKKFLLFPIFLIFCYCLPVSYYSGFKSLYTYIRLNSFENNLNNSSIKADFVNGQKFCSYFLMMDQNASNYKERDKEFNDFINNKTQEYIDLQTSLSKIDAATYEIFKTNLDNSKDGGRLYISSIGNPNNFQFGPDENMWTPDKISPSTYSVLQYQMKLAFGIKSLIIGLFSAFLLYSIYILIFYRQQKTTA